MGRANNKRTWVEPTTSSLHIKPSRVEQAEFSRHQNIIFNYI